MPMPKSLGRFRLSRIRATPVRRPIQAVRVVPHTSGWAVMVDELPEPAWVLSSKQQCVRSATAAASELGCQLTVMTKAGNVQQERDFSQAGEV